MSSTLPRSCPASSLSASSRSARATCSGSLNSALPSLNRTWNLLIIGLSFVHECGAVARAVQLAHGPASENVVLFTAFDRRRDEATGFLRTGALVFEPRIVERASH